MYESEIPASKFYSLADEFRSDDRGRSLRLKQILFPDENIEISGTESKERIRPFSSIDHLYKPTQKFRFIVTGFINYIVDTDAAIRMCPELIQMINDDQKSVYMKGLEYIHNLCKKQASRLGLASSAELINGLKHHLQNPDPAALEHALASVQHISKGRQGSVNLFGADIIPIMVENLKSNNKKIIECSVSVLDNLIKFVERAKDVVRSRKGVEYLVALLENGDPNVKLRTVIFDCLHKLLYRHQESKLAMQTVRGGELTVECMRQFTYEKLLYAASRVMKVLSACTSNKPILVEVGAVETLTNCMLRPKSARLMQSCLWSVRNLSDHASHLPGMRDLMKILIDLLDSDDKNESFCAVGCLCNLTSKNTDNKVAFVEFGGVEKMCQVVCENNMEDDVVEPGIACLRHSTYLQPLADKAVSAINGSPLISNLSAWLRAKPNKKLPMIKAFVGLIRNLALSSSKCRLALIDVEVTSSICKIFLLTYEAMGELARQRNSIVSISSELSYVEGVRLEDLLELCLISLQALARESQAQKIIYYQNGLLHKVMNIAMVREYSPPLHRACLGLLADMVEYGDCVRLMENEGLGSHLSELLNSPNKAISLYSAVIIHVMNRDKPPEYRDRIQRELMESLQEQMQSLEHYEVESNGSMQSQRQQQQQQQQPQQQQHRNMQDYYGVDVIGKLPEVPTTRVGQYHDNRGYVPDFDQSPSKSSYHSRQIHREAFEDMEL